MKPIRACCGVRDFLLLWCSPAGADQDRIKNAFLFLCPATSLLGHLRKCDHPGFKKANRNRNTARCIGQHRLPKENLKESRSPHGNGAMGFSTELRSIKREPPRPSFLFPSAVFLSPWCYCKSPVPWASAVVVFIDGGCRQQGWRTHDPAALLISKNMARGGFSAAAWRRRVVTADLG